MDVLAINVMLKALDALSLRSEVTAENIANANTVGFVRRGVSFEQTLATAAHQGLDQVRQVTPQIMADPDTSAPGARLDLDLATQAATTSRYGAIVEVLGRQLQIDNLAIDGGRQ